MVIGRGVLLFTLWTPQAPSLLAPLCGTDRAASKSAFKPSQTSQRLQNKLMADVGIIKSPPAIPSGSPPLLFCTALALTTACAARGTSGCSSTHLWAARGPSSAVRPAPWGTATSSLAPSRSKDAPAAPLQHFGWHRVHWRTRGISGARPPLPKGSGGAPRDEAAAARRAQPAERGGAAGPGLISLSHLPSSR